MSVAEKSTDTPIDEGRSQRIGDIAQRVGPIFAIVGKPRIGGSADIAGGEGCEKRVLSRAAVAVTFISSRPAAGQNVALLLLRPKMPPPGEHPAEILRE